MYAKATDVARVYAAADVAYANVLQQRAVKLDFAPPLKALETLHRLYYPLRFKGGTLPPTQHPILAGHQRVAEEVLHNFARGRSTVLEIGPSLHSALKLHGAPNAPVADYHGCTKYGTRDGSRHITALESRSVATGRPEFKADASLLANGIASRTFCVDGVGSCAFKSRVGIANHSLYDVTLEELANAFENHGLHMVRAFMHMPEELLYMDNVVNAELGYRFHVIEEPMAVKDCAFQGGDLRLHFPELDFINESQERRIERLAARGSYSRRAVIFSGDDDWGDAYLHDFHTWLAYLLVRNYPTPFGFSLHIEVQRRHGSSIELRITRAPPGDRMLAVVPRTSQGLCRIPNIFYYADASGTEHKTILTSQHKVNMLLNFMQTRPEKELVDMTVLMSFARARLRAIVVASEVTESSWNISPADLVRTVVSLYVLHIIERRRAAVAVKTAKDDVFGETSFWESLKHVLGSCCGLRNLKGTDVVFTKRVVDKYRVHSLGDIICDVRLSPEQVGFLPSRVPPARVFHDREELEVLREAGCYNERPVPSTPPVEEPQGFDADLWHATAASLPEYRATLQAGLNTDVKQLKITLENALKTIDGLTLSPVRGLEMYEGPPGSGKTGTLIAALEAAGGKALYVAPTRELREAMDRRIKPPSASATQHVALAILRRATAEGAPFATVVIDECFMFPLVYVAIVHALSPSSRIVLVGDVHQIGFIDFQGTSANMPLVRDVVKQCRRRTFNQTKRCPADVVATTFFQSLYPGCTTTSGCVASISHVAPDYRNSQAQTLCFTQEEKSRHGAEGAMTVHEAQGRTFASVILHYNGSTAEQKLLAEKSHLLVGITRHTNHLYIRDPTGDIERQLNHSAKAEVFTDIPAPLEITTVKPSEEVQRNEVMATIPPQSATPHGAIHLLRKNFGDQPDCGCVALAKTGYEVFGGRAKINVELAEPDATPKPHRAFQEGVQWVKVTNASNKHQALQTLLSRYTKRSADLPLHEAKEDVKRMLNSLDRHWDWTVTEDARDRAVFETQLKFTQRGGTVEDLLEPDDPYIRDIDFLMKTQQKVSPKPINTGKVGQGIAAHSKSLNFVLAAWIRILEEILRTGSRTVRYSNGLPDEEEAMLLEAKINQVPHATFVSADWTEFDTAHNNTSELLFAALLERIGTPAAAVNLFRERCGKRTLRAKGLGSVEVDGLLDSGAVWTLCRNTIFSAAVMLTLFRGVKFAAFKGDDSLLCGSHYLRFDASRLHMGERYKTKHLKVEVQKIVPYIGLLVSAEQVVLDPVRSALKIFGRCYTSELLYSKYVEAVRDITKGWSDARYHSLLCHMSACYYNYAPESAAYIIDAVVRFGRGDFPFEQLRVVRAHVQAPDAYSSTYPANVRASCLDHVFEPRQAAAPAGFVATCAKPETPSSLTAKAGVSATTSHVATGTAPPESPWDAPAANSFSELLTPETPSTSSSPSSSSSDSSTSCGRSLSGGDTARTTEDLNSRKPPSQDRQSRSSECLDRSGERTGSSLTAPTAPSPSFSFSERARLATGPTVAAATSPSATPSCATDQVAARTTPDFAPFLGSQSARAVSKPYRPPTTARWKEVTPLHAWKGVTGDRPEVREDPETAAVVQALISGRYPQKTKLSSDASKGYSRTKGCSQSTSFPAPSAVTRPATARQSESARAAAEMARSCIHEPLASSAASADLKRIRSTSDSVPDVKISKSA
uniref:RNA-dependent RNA polymerase n=1 Tax=Helicoverpa armigera stunt virus TaxID=37206 RepID=A0A1V0JZM5_HASV|nr:RNA-dependent RNA polymerase [Helicoverpa armigera stunt virus]